MSNVLLNNALFSFIPLHVLPPSNKTMYCAPSCTAVSVSGKLIYVCDNEPCHKLCMSLVKLSECKVCLVLLEYHVICFLTNSVIN